MIALACTLPRQEGQPFSRWSIPDLIKTAIAEKIVPRLSAPTLWRWLKADKIKPWKFHTWQKPTDPRFLERAVPVLDLYAQAQELARAGHIIVCADEKPSIQARQLQGGMQGAKPGRCVRVGDRYKRQGAIQLFAALQVATGETLARCFARKCFVDFQQFLRTLFGSLWCQKIHCLHLILDNGPTHARKQLAPWIASLQLPFQVQIHWLPVHASWLDQVEIVFSKLQRRVLTPNHFTSTQELARTVLEYFDCLNQNPKPVKWTYTSDKLRNLLQRQALRAAA
jgi:DDE superfamily endonuclease